MNSPAPIYLDNNSTTPIHPEVAESMLRAAKDLVGNPASQHSLGRKARRVLEEAREGIVSLLGGKTGGMDADRLIFTSGGTEANQLAIRGMVECRVQSAECGAEVPQPNIVISSIEHPSALGAAAALAHAGMEVRRLPALKKGCVDVPQLTRLIDERTQLVSVMFANNETGVVQGVHDLALVTSEKGIPFHTDAVQAIGKIPVNFREVGVTAMSVAPHKFHGPLGIGGLLLKHGAKLQPIFHGGFQQGGLRPGTESVALAVGFHSALVMANKEMAQRQARMTALRDELETLLLAGAPRGVIIGAAAPRLPTTTCIAFPGINRQALVMALDMAGVACSTGSACASGSSEPSATLVAMGLPQEQIESAIRLSLSAVTTLAEVQEAANRILKCVNHLRRQ
ncbi:MAG: cysteine desulfurase family protein [Pirellulaceae bacterium]